MNRASVSGPECLVVRAGRTAAARLREEGFHPDLFGTLVGASGGPKWLVLRCLDDFWSERLIAPRSLPIEALGSSIGSFRHACLGLRDAPAALERFCESYLTQSYDERRPSMQAISRESEAILAELLGEKGGEEIALHQRVRNHFVAARLSSGHAFDRGLGLRLQLGVAALANAFDRRALGRFFERGVFGPDESSIAHHDFPTRRHSLTPESVAPALLASGSIPLVMEAVERIGSQPGPWFDGGILDYHFDFEFERAPGLVLFPHFFDRITPGWLDKPLSWRKPRRQALDDVVMVAPSEAFVASLPGGQVPDRNDFLAHGEAERIERWREVLDRSRALVDAWADLVDAGRLGDVIQPF